MADASSFAEATEDWLLALSGCGNGGWLRDSRSGEMADAQDLKSWASNMACGFESRLRHQPMRR